MIRTLKQAEEVGNLARAEQSITEFVAALPELTRVSKALGGQAVHDWLWQIELDHGLRAGLRVYRDYVAEGETDKAAAMLAALPLGSQAANIAPLIILYELLKVATEFFDENEPAADALALAINSSETPPRGCAPAA